MSAATAATIGTSPGRSAVVLALGRTLRTWRGGLSALCLLAVVAAALLAPWVAPYAYDAQNLQATNQAPTLAHWLGTDEFGRCLLYTSRCV